jgi:hypothetical protein
VAGAAEACRLRCSSRDLIRRGASSLGRRQPSCLADRGGRCVGVTQRERARGRQQVGVHAQVQGQVGLVQDLPCQPPALARGTER